MVTALRSCPRAAGTAPGPGTAPRARTPPPACPGLPPPRLAPPACPGHRRRSSGRPGSAERGFVRLKVKPMDKEEEKADNEEQDHIPPENERGSSEECLPEAKETEEETEHVIKNIPWTTSKDFTVERGRQQIEELISTWDIHESWLHHSEFLEEEELKDSKRYHYRACWGLPTRRKPIPRATANVYFVIVISKFKPDTAPVEIFYRLESSRLIRRPEQCQFREKWLQDIIENKIVCAERLASRRNSSNSPYQYSTVENQIKK